MLPKSLGKACITRGIIIRRSGVQVPPPLPTKSKIETKVIHSFVRSSLVSTGLCDVFRADAADNTACGQLHMGVGKVVHVKDAVHR